MVENTNIVWSSERKKKSVMGNYQKSIFLSFELKKLPKPRGYRYQTDFDTYFDNYPNKEKAKEERDELAKKGKEYQLNFDMRLTMQKPLFINNSVVITIDAAQRIEQWEETYGNEKKGEEKKRERQRKNKTIKEWD